MTLAAGSTSAAFGVAGGALAGLVGVAVNEGPVDPSQRPVAAAIVR